MPRPKKWRNVCCLPGNNRFGPLDLPVNPEEPVNMTVEEYETIRLIDLESFTQEECAAQMNVARTTVQGIYETARKKLADVLIHGKMLQIEGGDYRLCDGHRQYCGKNGCRGPMRHGCGDVMSTDKAE